MSEKKKINELGENEFRQLCNEARIVFFGTSNHAYVTTKKSQRILLVVWGYTPEEIHAEFRSRFPDAIFLEIDEILVPGVSPSITVVNLVLSRGDMSWNETFATPSLANAFLRGVEADAALRSSEILSFPSVQF